MDGIDPRIVVRAWRDPKFAASLPEPVRRRIPASPAGEAPGLIGVKLRNGSVEPQGTIDRTCNTIDRTCNTIDRTCNTIDRTCNTIDRTCNTIDRTCNTIDRTCNTIDGSCTAPVRCRTASIDAAHRAGTSTSMRSGTQR